ncbi:hypothetical protein ACOMHN_046563 [Nucella lapillus]
MDLLGKHLADNDRYAFLLGSALRNDDYEQFFSIYDSIVPKELSDAQVEKIKEQARFIADLPEDEFNELVLNARDFSLARGRPASFPLLAMSTGGQGTVSEDHGLQGALGTNLDLNAGASAHVLCASGGKDDDSGLPSSTKTERHASVSSEDTTEMEVGDQYESGLSCSDGLTKHDVGEEKTEKKTDVPRLRETVAARHSYNPEYEEVAVEHDDESVESPRSDASSTREYDVTQPDGEDGVEMTTFSSERRGYYDEYDSDDNIHPSPYVMNSWGFRAPPGDSSISAINFDLSSKLLAEGKTISSLRNTPLASGSSGVDESVNFSLGCSSAQSVRSPDRASGALSSSRRSPPFGSGKDLLRKVGESVSFLVSAQDHEQRKAEEEPKHSKKKQKQKKEKKDDGTREGGNGGKLLTKDINGNPAETEDSQQMREVQLDDKSSAVSEGGRPGSSGTHNHEMGHTQGEDLAGSQSTSRRQRRNKRNARQQGVDVYPDQDKNNYYGDVKNVNHLVEFINNHISAENLKEIDGNLKGRDPQVKSSKKKERNKVKTSGAGGSSDASDTHWTEQSSLKQAVSFDEQSTTKETEAKKPVDNLHDKDTTEMGNTSSSEKLDTNEEDEAVSSSSKVTAEEPAASKKKTKSETQKPESGKNPKIHVPVVVSNKKTPAITKEIKNNEDQRKPQLQCNLKDADTEDTKVKISKKGKSKAVKKYAQKEFNKRISSPSPREPRVDSTGSTQGQWCTVVSKPQKKKKSQAQTSAVAQNCYTPIVSSQTRPKDKQVSPSAYSIDHSRRGPQQSALQHSSIKPQSYTLPSLKTAEWERREKDLSPSDFPVLNSSPREYRRSLENVFDTGALISDKDSDKESSKSFPADAGLAGHCKTSYPVSYASMASANRALDGVESSKAANVSSSVEDSNAEFSVISMPLKWKGSPQERRHSIGSAPKEWSKSVLQRTGSQEMLPCDKNLTSLPVTVPNEVDNAGGPNLVASDSTGSFTGSDVDSARGSEAGSEGTGEELTAAITNTNTTSHLRTPVEVKSSGVSAVGQFSYVKPDSGKTSPTTKSIPVEPALMRSQTVGTETTVSSSGAKQTNNGRKKGVVFFCSQSDKCTPITGLHFGSFHEEEYASIVTNSALKKSMAMNGEPGGDFISSSGDLSHSSQQPAAPAPARKCTSLVPTELQMMLGSGVQQRLNESEDDKL